MIRRPPRSTLFPSRRSSDLLTNGTPGVLDHEDAFTVTVKASSRSEEHTSELQSRENLVCRLLLEKKKISLFRAIHTLLIMSIIVIKSSAHATKHTELTNTCI